MITQSILNSVAQWPRWHQWQCTLCFKDYCDMRLSNRAFQELSELEQALFMEKVKQGLVSIPDNPDVAATRPDPEWT